MLKNALKLAEQFKIGFQAAQRVRQDFLGLGARDTREDFMGMRIVHWEDMCLINSGIPELPMAMVVPDQPYIYVNAALLALPRSMRDGLLAHEVGHLHLEHKPPLAYTLQAYFGFGKGLELEMEADEYALELGYNPLPYLEHIYHSGMVKSRALKKRIYNLQTL